MAHEPESAPDAPDLIALALWADAEQQRLAYRKLFRDIYGWAYQRALRGSIRSVRIGRQVFLYRADLPAISALLAQSASRRAAHPPVQRSSMAAAVQA